MAVQIRQEQRGDDRAGYAVGYGKPPKEYRFKKGQSGNPDGKKKYKLDYSSMSGLQRAIAKEMRRKVSIREGGKNRKVMQQDVIAKRLMASMMGASELDRLRAFRAMREVRAIEMLADAELRMCSGEETDRDRQDLEEWNAQLEESLKEFRDEVQYPWEPQYAWDPFDELGEPISARVEDERSQDEPVEQDRDSLENDQGKRVRQIRQACAREQASGLDAGRCDESVAAPPGDDRRASRDPPRQDARPQHCEDPNDPTDLAHGRLDQWPQPPPRGR